MSGEGGAYVCEARMKRSTIPEGAGIGQAPSIKPFKLKEHGHINFAITSFPIAFDTQQ